MNPYEEGYLEPVWAYEEFEPATKTKLVDLVDGDLVEFKSKDMAGIFELNSIYDSIFGNVGWLGFNLDEAKILYAINGKAVLN